MKLVQMCCLMRKSSLKHRRRLQNLQVAVIFADKMKLLLAHTLFPELFYLQELPFVPGAHNKMDKFLEIVAFKKGNRAKELGIYCHHSVL